MKCANCGAELGEKDLFCPNCGSRIQTVSFEFLTDAIRDQTGMTYPESEEFAWRIFHEYPMSFLAAASEIAKGKIPDIHVGQTSLDKIIYSTGIPAFDALEILYIYQKDPKFAESFLIRYSPTDNIG